MGHDQAVTLYKQGDWQAVLELASRGEIGELYLWVRPSRQDFCFLGEQLRATQVERVLSVGCGTGLLEWLLHCITGLQVDGVEVDRCWWESPYAPSTFIPLHYADEEDISCSPDAALLFCYFNNRPAFSKYLSSFSGHCLVVIGPGEGAGRHTDPEPFDPELAKLGWTIQAAHEIQHTKDHIVVYRRTSG